MPRSVYLGGSGGGASLIHQASVTLTDAQIKALPTLGSAGVEIVPAVDADTLLVFLLGTFGPSVMAAPYTNITGGASTGFYIRDPLTSNDVSAYAEGSVSGNLIALTWDGAGAVPIVVLYPQLNISAGYFVTPGASDVGNSFVFVGFNTGDFTDGDPSNTWKVSVAYMKYRLSTGLFE